MVMLGRRRPSGGEGGMRLASPIVAALVLLVLSLSGAARGQDAERRVALVIGNGAYVHAAALASPANDAREMGRMLAELGFEVQVEFDVGSAAMHRALLDFSDRAQAADVALLFYAGHGVQMGARAGAENFLVPVDATMADARLLEDEAVRLSRVLDLMEGAASRIVVLDACRDNPLLPRMANAAGARSVGRGLAPVEGPSRGTLVAFSTAPGAVAADGTGPNSPFTAALLRHLPTPGAELRTVFTRVRAEVARATDGVQTPWTNDGLLQEVFIASVARPPPAEIANDRPQPEPQPQPLLAPGLLPQLQVGQDLIELTFWQSMQPDPSEADLRAYLERFPSGAFAVLARNRLAVLEREAAAAAAERVRLEEERVRVEAERARLEDDRLRAEREEAERRRREAAEAEKRRQEEERRRRTQAEEERRRQEAERARVAERTGDERSERALGIGREQWAEVQGLLNALGHSAGSADGVPGRRTRAAIEDYQRAQRLPATGFLTPALIGDLRTAGGPALARLEAEERRARELEESRRRAERERQEEGRRRADADRRARVQRAFDTGDLREIAGCWRHSGNWGFLEFCFSGASGVGYQFDITRADGSREICSTWPGARLAGSGTGQLLFDLPQTSGNPCRSGSNPSDQPREAFACRLDAGRSDRMRCDRTGYGWNPSTSVSFTEQDRVFTHQGTGQSSRPAGSASGGNLLAMGGSVSGRISNFEQRDRFRVDLTAGALYQFDLDGRDSLDAYLVLFGPDGAELARDDDGGGSLDSQIQFRPSRSGAHTLSAEGFAGSTGPYTISARVLASGTGDDHAATVAGAAPLAVGRSVQGRIGAPRDQDWFRIDLVVGTTYHFSLEGSDGLDAYLRLLGADGRDIMSDDDGGGGLNSLIVFTASRGGTYVLSAEGLGDSTGRYTLSARRN